jgi:hypothetical protein
MHTTLAIAFAAGVLVAHPSHAEPVTEQRPVAALRAIELSGPYRVLIRAQGKPALELSGERKQLAEVETIVSGDTLIVRPVPRNGFHFGIMRRRDDVTIHITASMLASLKMSGSGDVELEQVGADQFSLTATGPGELRASGAVRDLTVASSGSGNLDLHQLSATNVKLAMSGPGDVSLAGIAGAMTAEVSGSGDLRADALRLSTLSALLRGPGNATLAGSSAELRAEVSGSGDLNACSLAVDRASTVQRGPGNACISGNLKRFDAEVHGSGDLEANGLQAASARIALTGPGGAKLAGSVGTLSAQLSGSGDLDARGLAVRNATDVAVRGPGNALVNVKDKGAGKARLMTIERGGAHMAAE